jgi:probable rRNA maturation factor
MILNGQRRVPIALAPLATFFECARCELRFPHGSVTVRLVSDPAMARLNRDYRGKSGPTDVLSFPAKRTANGQQTKALSPKRVRSQEATENDSYVGDIAIAPETARRNARRFSRGLPAELRVLILHGMIHLAGYDHETDQGEMERLEQRLRRRLGLPWP